MAPTKSDPAVALRAIGERVKPPFTQQETDLALRRLGGDGDPVAEAERILDERVGLSARAVRERDGDPYPPLDTLLDEADQRARLEGKLEKRFGKAEEPPASQIGGAP